MIATKQTKSGVVADVAAAVVSTNRDVCKGVCVGTDSNTICAELTAIATMTGATKTYLVHTVVPSGRTRTTQSMSSHRVDIADSS